MYEEIGQISNETVSELRATFDSLKWEEHVSDKTLHEAAICKEQVKDVDEIVCCEFYERT